MKQATTPRRNINPCHLGTRNGDVTRTEQLVEGARAEEHAMVRDEQPAAFGRPTLRHRGKSSYLDVLVRPESLRHRRIISGVIPEHWRSRQPTNTERVTCVSFRPAAAVALVVCMLSVSGCGDSNSASELHASFAKGVCQASRAHQRARNQVPLVPVTAPQLVTSTNADIRFFRALQDLAPTPATQVSSDEWRLLFDEMVADAENLRTGPRSDSL